MNTPAQPTRSGNSLASAPNFSRDLWELAQRNRASSAALNISIGAMSDKDARRCERGLVTLRHELLAQLRICHELESKLAFALIDDWENAEEVYGD